MKYENYDYVVIGLGSIGSMALWQLSERVGKDTRVLGLEQFARLHPYGSYAGESRLFRMALKEGPEYIELVKRSRELYLRLNELSGRDVFLSIGALSIGPKEHENMRITEQVISEFSLESETIEGADLKDRFPQFAFNDDDYGIYDPLGGGIRPELAVFTAQEQALANGAEIVDNTPITSVHQLDDGVEIVTDTATIHANKVICAAGSWTPQLLPELADRVRVERLVLTWYVPSDIDRFSPSSMPVFMRDTYLDDGTFSHTFGAPSLDGYSVKVTIEPDDPAFERVDDTPTGVSTDFMAQSNREVAASMPALAAGSPRATVHHDGYTADGTPIIETTGDITVLAGMSGRGMKFAPVYGQLGAQLALGETPDLRPAQRTSCHV